MQENNNQPTSRSALQDYSSLYMNFIVYHVILTVFFCMCRIWSLTILNALNILFYVVGVYSCKRKVRTAGILIMDLVVIITTSLSSYILNCGSGFSLVGFMTIPTSLFYLYVNIEEKEYMKKVFGIINLFLLLNTVSCIVNFKDPLIGEEILTPWQSHVVLICNISICTVSLVSTSIRFAWMNRKNTISIENKNKDLEYNLTHDALTGQYNIAGFSIAAKELFEKYPDEDFSFILSDINDFKLINEILGEQAGDQLLKDQVDWLKAQMKGKSVLGHLQADRFIMIVPSDKVSEEYFAELIKELSKKYSTNNYHFHMYLGVYKVVDRNETIRSMTDKTLMALKKVKGNMDKLVVYYTEQNLLETKTKQELLASFDEAIQNEQFEMYLQPQTDKNGKLFGAEALIRWNHPEKGLIFPGDFIELFEEARIIHKLDEYIWRCAARQIKVWHEKGYNYYISVNVSVKDFYMLDIYEVFNEIVEEYQIPREKLRIEITETAIAEDVNGMTKMIKRLRDKGFVIEIDDFGSGYSSLNFLKNLNADVLKIDREFVAETKEKVKAKVILQSMINLAFLLGLRVITEGVETKEQVDMLADMGVICYQGYYFSKPICVKDFEEKYSL